MPETQCPECAKLRAELVAATERGDAAFHFNENQAVLVGKLRTTIEEQRAQFDSAWKELLHERDALRASVDAFQEQADRRRIGWWRAWLPWLTAAALFGAAGLWWWIIRHG